MRQDAPGLEGDFGQGQKTISKKKRIRSEGTVPKTTPWESRAARPRGTAFLKAYTREGKKEASY